MNRINILSNIIIGIMMIIFVVLAVKLNAQTVGEVYADNDAAYLVLGTDAELPASEYTYTTSVNGDYTIKAKWQLSVENPYIPEKGTSKIMLDTFISYADKENGGLDVATLGEHDSEEMEVRRKVTINQFGECQAVIEVRRKS